MNQQLEKGAKKASLIAAWASDAFCRFGLYPLLLSIAAAAGLWSIFNLDLLPELAANRVPKTDRHIGIAMIGGVAAGIAAIYLFVAQRHRRRTGSWPAHTDLYPIHRRLAFLFAVPVFGILATPEIERQEPIFVMFLIAAGSLAVVPTLVELLRSSRLGSIPGSGAAAPQGGGGFRRFWAQYGPAIVVSIIFLAYVIWFSRLAVIRLWALKTHTTDMTIYTNVLYRTWQGDLLGCSLMKGQTHASAHFDPILILLAPLYALYPEPEFLLVAQTVWLGFGMFPAFWLTRRLLGSGWAGVAVAAVYGLHPSLQMINLFEFHSLALVTSPLLLAIFLLEAGYFRRFFVLLPFMLLIREDVPLLLCFVGLWVILAKRADAWVGVVTILTSIAYFAVVKLFFMESGGMIMSGKGAYNYTHYFQYMIPHKGGVRDLLVSILTNPVYTIRSIVTLEKIEFVLRLLAPLFFIPLFARKERVMLIYGVVFLLLATREAVFGYRYHYQAVAYPVLIALVAYGLRSLRERPWFGLGKARRLVVLTVPLVLSVALNGVMFGALLEAKTLRHKYPHRLTPRQEATLATIREYREMIEPDASVLASYGLAPFVAGRMNIYSMNHYRPKRFDYIFIDRRGTKREMLDHYDKQIRKGIYKKIARKANIALYKWVPQKERDRKKQARGTEGAEP